MSILGIDVGGTSIKLGWIEGGTVHAERKVPVDPDKTFQEHLNDLVPVLHQLRDQASEASTEIRGIGMSFPGVVDGSSPSIESTLDKFTNAPGVNIERWAKKTFDLSIILENDAHCFLLGERYFGAGTGTSNLLMVTLGTGFGASALINDQLLTGVHHQAGILGGHMTIRKQGYACMCGNQGCVETETGEWNLPRIIKNHNDYTESALSERNELTYRTLIDSAEKGDDTAQSILQERLEYMARGIVNLIHAYDPEKVVVGGGVMNRSDVVLPVLRDEIQEYAFTPWGKVSIAAAEHPDYGALLGLYGRFEHDIQTV